MTSWMTSLFASTQTSQLVPTDDHDSNLDNYGDERGTSYITDKRRKRNEALAEEEEARPPYLHSMLAGAIGGTSGDLLMHPIDTIKTRQQGDPNLPPKYTSFTSSGSTIIRQEGIRRGLYSGVAPAFLGSFPGTLIFFGTYEYSKRSLIDAGVHHSLAYLASGFFADLAASVVYVPSEVLKTRLQLQGRHNNPFFSSGYNYRSTMHAARMIVRYEGPSALFYGYKATLWRDLPFSALQFTFYEWVHKWAKEHVGSRDIGLGWEILTGATSGGVAGVATCPLDVVKTRIQTQVNPLKEVTNPTPANRNLRQRPLGSVPAAASTDTKSLSQPNPSKRFISTSSPNTSLPKPGAIKLDTPSVLTGLKVIYQTEGFAGLFRGVGPRLVWTSVQSGIMLVSYQFFLRQMEI
ncbi:hypothetical protein MMC07_005970 [Pseudocyphellaria aurata]|nr:hypothetical protein [Pseudocyphellaria aurata]